MPQLEIHSNHLRSWPTVTQAPGPRLSFGGLTPSYRVVLVPHTHNLRVIMEDDVRAVPIRIVEPTYRLKPHDNQK